MKAYLLKLALYISIALLPLLLLEFLMRQPASDMLIAKKTFFDENISSGEVIILGSSYALTGLNPELIDKNCVNLAMTNQPFYYDYQILKKCISRMANLRTVILPLSYPIFFAKPDKRQESLYHIYWGLPPYSGEKDFESYSVVLALGLKNAWEQWNTGENWYVHKGWKETPTTFDGTTKNLQARFDIMHEFMDTSNVNENVRVLRQIIEICRNNRIRLVLYLSPFLEDYAQKVENDQPFKASFDAAMKELRKDKSLEIYDFNDHELFTPGFFRDPDHLNTKGAKILSGQIKEILTGKAEKVNLKTVKENS